MNGTLDDKSMSDKFRLFLVDRRQTLAAMLAQEQKHARDSFTLLKNSIRNSDDFLSPLKSREKLVKVAAV